MIGTNHNKLSNLNQLQDMINTYQELGITIIKEKICAWYPIHTQNSDKAFEIGKVKIIYFN